MLQTATHAETSRVRRHGRHRVMLSAKLYTTHGTATVVLLDLSQGGAMLALPLPLPKGAHVVLVRGDLEAHGTVVWSQGRRCGLQFDEPIAESVIDRTIATAAARSAH